MKIKFNSEIVAAVEERGGKWLDYCLYPTLEAMQINDAEERRKVRILTIEFEDVKEMDNFCAISSSCVEFITATFDGKSLAAPPIRNK